MAGMRTVNQMNCSLYISSRNEFQPDIKGGNAVAIDPSLLDIAIQELQPSGNWTITKTSCGLIVSFTVENDANKLLESDLVTVLGGPVRVARLSANTNFKQAVLMVNVPWAIPIEDILDALKAEGFSLGRVTRARQHIRVEILDSNQYESILLNGFNFHDVMKFRTVPERTWQGLKESNRSEDSISFGPQDAIMQCFHCQGFWHVAAHCRQVARCVRCGGTHDVKYCPRARNDPICCHCSGPHHAAHWDCPVRKKIYNSTPITISLMSEQGKQTKQTWTGGS